MKNTVDAQGVVDAVVAAFPDKDARPSPEQVEQVMRPFGVISCETELAIKYLLRKRGRSDTSLDIGCWMEANFVASGEGTHLERRILFLMGDTCTCVLEHLPKAIAHATKPVDPRIRGLLDHEYFQGQKQ